MSFHSVSAFGRSNRYVRHPSRQHHHRPVPAVVPEPLPQLRHRQGRRTRRRRKVHMTNHRRWCSRKHGLCSRSAPAHRRSRTGSTTSHNLSGRIGYSNHRRRHSRPDSACRSTQPVIRPGLQQSTASFRFSSMMVYVSDSPSCSCVSTPRRVTPAFSDSPIDSQSEIELGGLRKIYRSQRICWIRYRPPSRCQTSRIPISGIYCRVFISACPLQNAENARVSGVNICESK